MQIRNRKDFGDGCHLASTEPYFYDYEYKRVSRDHAIPEYGVCVVVKPVTTDDKKGNKKPPIKRECTRECKFLTDCEVNAIVDLKSNFDRS